MSPALYSAVFQTQPRSSSCLHVTPMPPAPPTRPSRSLFQWRRTPNRLEPSRTASPPSSTDTSPSGSQPVTVFAQPWMWTQSLSAATTAGQHALPGRESQRAVVADALVRHRLEVVLLRQNDAADVPRVHEGWLVEQRVEDTEQPRAFRQRVENLQRLEGPHDRSVLVLALQLRSQRRLPGARGERVVAPRVQPARVVQDLHERASDLQHLCWGQQLLEVDVAARRGAPPQLRRRGLVADPPIGVQQVVGADEGLARWPLVAGILRRAGLRRQRGVGRRPADQDLVGVGHRRRRSPGSTAPVQLRPWLRLCEVLIRLPQREQLPS